jgi:hypothetical protein
MRLIMTVMSGMTGIPLWLIWLINIIWLGLILMMFLRFQMTKRLASREVIFVVAFGHFFFLIRKKIFLFLFFFDLLAFELKFSIELDFDAA